MAALPIEAFAPFIFRRRASKLQGIRNLDVELDQKVISSRPLDSLIEAVRAGELNSAIALLQLSGGNF